MLWFYMTCLGPFFLGSIHLSAVTNSNICQISILSHIFGFNYQYDLRIYAQNLNWTSNTKVIRDTKFQKNLTVRTLKNPSEYSIRKKNTSSFYDMGSLDIES